MQIHQVVAQSVLHADAAGVALLLTAIAVMAFWRVLLQLLLSIILIAVAVVVGAGLLVLLGLVH